MHDTHLHGFGLIRIVTSARPHKCRVFGGGCPQDRISVITSYRACDTRTLFVHFLIKLDFIARLETIELDGVTSLIWKVETRAATRAPAPWTPGRRRSASGAGEGGAARRGRRAATGSTGAARRRLWAERGHWASDSAIHAIEVQCRNVCILRRKGWQRRTERQTAYHPRQCRSQRCTLHTGSWAP